MEINRRSLLIGSAAVAAPFVGGGAEAKDVPRLKVLASEKGIEIGSCYSGSQDRRVWTLLTQHAAIITPEWSLKPRFLASSEDAPYRFDAADAIYSQCQKSNLRMHGHTLFWHGDRFDWADLSDLTEVERKYGAFIERVVSRYPDLPSWDVANEVVSDTAGSLLRDDYLLKTHGLGLLAFLFRHTRRLAPNAQLCLNDYNLECGPRWCNEKRQRFLDVLDELLDRGTPIDAVGLQSHLSSRHGPGIGATLDFLEQVARRGLVVFLSEADVNDIDFPDDIAERDEAVATMYSDYLVPILAHRAVRRLVFWGLSDRDHWLVREPADDRRPLGGARPALFDQKAEPKPAFHSVVSALKSAPARS